MISFIEFKNEFQFLVSRKIPNFKARDLQKIDWFNRTARFYYDRHLSLGADKAAEYELHKFKMA